MGTSPYPLGIAAVAIVALSPRRSTLIRRVTWLGQVASSKGHIEATYVGMGSPADVHLEFDNPTRVEDQPRRTRAARRRVVMTGPDGADMPLSPWLPPQEAFRVAECVNRGRKKAARCRRATASRLASSHAAARAWPRRADHL